MEVNPNFFIVKISKELQKKKRTKMTISTQGYLGIKYSQQEDKRGFMVLTVEEGSPAFNAGFKEKDIITAINGKKVENFTQMIEFVTQHPPGAEITISYINALSVYAEVSTKTVFLGEKPLYLEIPEGSQDMRFNLQFGEIVKVGAKAAIAFPEALLNDTLLFHHAVEYKERSANDATFNDWHLLEDDDNFEYRFVHAETESLGVWKIKEKEISKAIIPFPTYIFCHPTWKKASMQMKNGVWLPDEWEISKEEMEQRLDDLKSQIAELNTNTIMQQSDNEDNYQMKDQIKAAIDSINKERRLLTKKMHQKKLVEATVLYVNPKTNEQFMSEVNRGDKLICDYFTLYPLDVFGAHYALARPNFIELLIKN